METKKCPRCKEVLGVDLFQKNKAAKDGLQYHCKACRKEIDSRPEHRKQHRERYHKNKHKTQGYKDITLKRTYGISLDDYNSLLEQQNHTCKICHNQCSSGRSLAVDHCHSTGKIRGLLCQKCNQGLGMFKDSEELLAKAIVYLQERKYGHDVSK